MFFEEYVDRVIRPRLDPIIDDGVTSVQDLTDKFNEAHSCKVSTTRMREWLQTLGYQLSRKVLIDRPGRQPRQQPRQAEEPPLDPPSRVETFNLPAMAVGMFTNVPMPGFQE